MPVVSSDGENAGEGHVEGGRNPEHLDSLWKNWICTQERRGKGESKVTPGCQGECLVMANPCTKAQNAEACTLHSFPSSLCRQADVCGHLSICGRSIALWLLIGFGLGAAPAETGIWEEGVVRIFTPIPWVPRFQAAGPFLLIAWNNLFPLQSSRAMTLWCRSSEGVSPFLVDLLCCQCSVAQSYPTLCDPMDCSTPGSSVLYYLPEFAQTHVLWVSDAI